MRIAIFAPFLHSTSSPRNKSTIDSTAKALITTKGQSIPLPIYACDLEGRGRRCGKRHSAGNRFEKSENRMLSQLASVYLARGYPDDTPFARVSDN